MKFIATPIILALAAGFASAQLEDVPECAVRKNPSIATNLAEGVPRAAS